jgi:hypothetical protein
MSEMFNFELVKEKYLDEFNTTGRYFKHIPSGAELLSLENDDENKVFGVVFRTPPNDSTGLPHIMEHSVLCGSEKYPVKEPFVELLKGSLHTFLNAFTYPDKTCYPVASQNLQDFYNLIDVYVDAVFHPLIPEHVLQQEGWHYEANDSDRTLSFKGVVYNEMKGAYSSPDNVLGGYIRASLFPDTEYKFDSGGDPKYIPDLTYDQFKSFHEYYYSPANARIFFYGDDDPGERLKRMDEYLQGFQPKKINSTISLQRKVTQPKRVTHPYVVSDADDANKAFVTVNWLLSEINNHIDVMSFAILSYILVGTPASPLRKALIDSGLGEDLTGSGLEDELRQKFFSTGLRGVKLPYIGQVEALILDTLGNIADEGIEQDMTAAALNTFEFLLRENNTGSFPRGLALMLRSLTTWLYDEDPFTPLEFEATLASIKESLNKNPRYFEELISSQLLGNNHRTTLIMEPDPELQTRNEALEQQRLADAQAQISEDDLQNIVQGAIRLKEIQEKPDSPEALARIPTLQLSDLDKQNKQISLEHLQFLGSEILYHDLFTNGIVYLDTGFDLHTLPIDLMPYVPLFGRALIEVGTEKEDFVKLSQRIGRTTGGLRPTTFTATKHETDIATSWLFLRGKATMDYTGDLLDILHDILLTTNFDNRERVLQMILENKASYEASLAPAGHQFVSSRLGAIFSEAGWVNEQMGGIDHLFFLRQLIHDIENDWESILGKLEAIRTILINRNNMVLNITLDRENFSKFNPQLKEFLELLPASKPQTLLWKPEFLQGFEGLTIPTQVNYVGKAANIYNLGYTFHGSILVITKHLGTTWLWDRVRVQGGAYGAFCSFNRRSGIFSYGSYRDPNLQHTLTNYDDTGSYLRQLELNDEGIAKSIIGTIGDLDAYQLPDAKGYSSMIRYLVGDTEENRQKLRDEVLNTSLEHFTAFADILDAVKDDGMVVVLGSQETITTANHSKPGWLSIKKVL